MRSVLLAGLFALVLLPGNARPGGPSYEQMAVDLLRQYLQVDTTVPPGNELKGALFLKGVLEAEGLTVELDEFAPGRANLLASLRGNGSRRPLILLNHIDVVPADPARWSVPPFSGGVQGGFIWGRGAQDMKSEGILQLLAVLRLHRERVPLDRDVLFLATADEEVGFEGALRALSQEGWRDRLAGAEFLITEGGENVLDEAGRPVYVGVDTAEKGPFWLTLRTVGTPGHGSRPIADSAPNRLIRALERVRAYRPSLKVLPSVGQFFRAQAGRVGGRREQWYRDLASALRDPLVARTLYDDREVSALLRNTISITVVRAGYKTNVIPGSAEAELDVRLLPGEDPEAFLAELRRVIDDPAVTIVAPDVFRPPNASATDTELYRAIERVVGRRYPGTPVTPRMLSGATESVLFRPLGIVAYGFTSLLTTREEVATVHGDDERVDERRLREAVGVFYQVVEELCASGR